VEGSFANRHLLGLGSVGISGEPAEVIIRKVLSSLSDLHNYMSLSLFNL